jgi:hypothetical protein
MTMSMGSSSMKKTEEFEVSGPSGHLSSTIHGMPSKQAFQNPAE